MPQSIEECPSRSRSPAAVAGRVGAGLYLPVRDERTEVIQTLQEILAQLVADEKDEAKRVDH